MRLYSCLLFASMVLLVGFWLGREVSTTLSRINHLVASNGKNDTASTTIAAAPASPSAAASASASPGASALHATRCDDGRRTTKVRFVRLTNDPAGGILQLSEVEAVDAAGVNVARGKPCSASSTLDQFRCENIVDGIAVGAFFASAGDAPGEFVEVDLGADVELAGVRVHNRDDSTGARMEGQQLLLLDSSRGRVAAFSLRGVRVAQFFDTPCSGGTPAPRRLAVAILLGRADPSAAVRSFVSAYAHFPYDFFVLYEHLTQAALEIDRLVPGGARFINVSSFFQRELIGGIAQTSCISHAPGVEDGYRLMCRFMSGPVYWLPDFDGYEQLLRFDDDSSFTSTLTTSLELRGTETYAYTYFAGDPVWCQLGIVELARSAYENASSSSEYVRWGPLTYSAPWVRAINTEKQDVTVFNCNFEVVSLAKFRSAHYRDFWARVEAAGLFFSTRLGDHELKTVYLETFERAENVVCYQNLPYSHPWAMPCSGSVEKGLASRLF